MPIQIDQTSFPIIVCTYQHEITYTETEDYLKRLGDLLQTNSPFVSLMRTEKLKRPERNIVQLQAEWFKQNTKRCESAWLGNAFIFDSALPRFILTSVLLLGGGMPMPYTTEGSFSKGLIWVCDILSRNKIALPEKLPIE
jgi:hypothetical protein